MKQLPQTTMKATETTNQRFETPNIEHTRLEDLAHHLNNID